MTKNIMAATHMYLITNVIQMHCLILELSYIACTLFLKIQRALIVVYMQEIIIWENSSF